LKKPHFSQQPREVGRLHGSDQSVTVTVTEFEVMVVSPLM
jgi:hypothetical protein